MKPRFHELFWLRGADLNHRPSGYEPDELPDCSTPRYQHSQRRVLYYYTQLPNKLQAFSLKNSR